MIRIKLLHRHVFKFCMNSCSSCPVKYRPFLNDLFICRMNLDLMDYPELNSEEDVTKINDVYKNCTNLLNDSKNCAQYNVNSFDAIIKQLVDSGLNNMQRCKAIELFEDDSMLSSLKSVHQMSIIDTIKTYGRKEQVEMYLPKLIECTVQGLFAVSHRPRDELKPCQSCITARLSADGTNYKLNGRISNIMYIKGASLILAIGQVIDDSKPGGVSTAFLIDSSSTGVSISKHPQQYSSTTNLSSCDVLLEEVYVSCDNILGPVGSGYQIERRSTITHNLMLSSVCCAVLKSTVKKCSQFVTDRKVFGVPLYDYENVKSEMVLICLDAFLSESMTYFISGHMDADDNRDWFVESTATKIFCVEALARSSDRLMQLLSHNGLRKDSSPNIDRAAFSLSRLYQSNTGLDRRMIALSCLDHFQAHFNDTKLSPATKFGQYYGLVADVDCYSTGNTVKSTVIEHLHPGMAALSQNVFVLFRKTAEYLHRAQEVHGQRYCRDGTVASCVADQMVSLWPMIAGISRVSRALCLQLPMHMHQVNLLRVHYQNLFLTFDQRFHGVDRPIETRINLLELAGTRNSPGRSLPHPIDI